MVGAGRIGDASKASVSLFGRIGDASKASVSLFGLRPRSQRVKSRDPEARGELEG